MPYENQLVNQPAAEEQSEGLDLIGFLRRRKAFIVVLGILGVGIGYMMFMRQVPQYKSDSQVQVIHRNLDPRVQSMMAENDLSDSDFVIKSPKTLGAAFTELRENQLDKLPAFWGNISEDAAIARIAGMISTRSLSANVIQVSATGSDPDEIKTILNAVSKVYVTSQQGDYKDASAELKDLLTTASSKFFEMLKTAEQEYSAFRASSKLNTDGDNPYRARTKAAQAKVSELELQKTELKAQVEQLESAIKRGGAREAILLLVGKENAGGLAASGTTQIIDSAAASAKSIAEALFPLMRQEAILAAELGADHPKLKLIRMQIEMTRNFHKELAGADGDRVGVQKAVEPAADFLSVYLQSLHEELLIIEAQQADLQALATKEDIAARELMKEEIEDTNRKNEMERLSKLFNETTLQISEIQVNAGMGGVAAHVLSPARRGYLVYPVRSQFLLLGGFLGAFAGLVLGYLVEMADRSFRKPEDILREFGIPIVGHVPFITEQRMKAVPAGGSMDRTAVSIHLPRSRPAEAYRAVRTAICFSAFGGSHRVLQVTSPAAGDGKSTLALNLALSMAQSGKKTILVESDFRRPKVHTLTGVNNKVGFVDVLRGDAELADAIQETDVADFSVLPCGPRPKDPAELLARPQFEQVLNALREKFEYVFVDSPPVLAVTDPCGVAARVDGVLVCMRLSRHTRDLGRRTIEQLRDVGATIAGIVINGVEEQDAYGYGNYRYSDYRYYYKNHNYKYGEYGSKDGQEYYADDTPSALDAVTQSKS